ncbi:polysaccharide pyruvyl transferase family protein, partial [bacterium]|nr:polysaccharide pyruvyl transferase family protein [bacterium]
EKFLPYNVLTILPAFVLRVPVYKFSQALGPFRNKLNRFLAKRCLKKCTRIFARGAFTLKNLRELDVPSAIYAPASDVAFSQKQGDSPSRENENVVNEVLESLNNCKNEKKQIIGICPSSVVASKFKKAGQDYVVFLKAIIEGIIQKGHRVMLFPNATREKHMGRMRNNDLAVIKLLTWYLNHLDAVLAVQKDINTDSIKCLIEKCDITVVSRFHSMVNSLERAVPPLVLGWGHKYLEVMEQFGQEEWVLDYSENDPSLLLEKVFTLLAHKNEAKEQIKKNLPEAKRKSFSQFEILFDGLNEEKQSIFL